MNDVRMPSAPQLVAPAGACDCHTHVFNSDAEPAQSLVYALPDAPYERHRAMLDTLGVERGVLVQPSAYGSDHAVLLAAIARSAGRLRGVGLLDEAASDADFDRLHAGGVRALRFVEARIPGTNTRYPGNVGIAALDTLRPRMAERGWHAEVWASLPDSAAICKRHTSQDVPLVFDHLAGAPAPTDPNDPDFRAVLAHVASGRAWVKLVLCRTAQSPRGYAPAQALHDALIAANPERLLWGSDFPFIRKGEDAPDAGVMIDQFAEWAGPHATTILTANPAALYRFSPF